jgi:hypothetical protein
MSLPESKRASQGVAPETLSVIAAVVTAFLGKKVRIHSAKMLPPADAVNRWARQGRVMVQTSHNLNRQIR